MGNLPTPGLQNDTPWNYTTKLLFIKTTENYNTSVHQKDEVFHQS